MPNNPPMPWYLPDRHPIFWENMRRRYCGRRRYGYLIFLISLALLALSVTLLFVFCPRCPRLSLSVLNAVEYFLAIQYLLIFHSSWLAVSVISGEREKGTFEMLLLTPITSRALVWQKFLTVISIAAYIPLIFAVLVPIICSISSGPVLERVGSYIILLLTMCSYIAMSMFVSCHCQKSRSAIVIADVTIIVLQFIFWFAQFVLYVLVDSPESEESGSAMLYFKCGQAMAYLFITLYCLFLSSRKIDELRGLARCKRMTYPLLPI